MPLKFSSLKLSIEESGITLWREKDFKSGILCPLIKGIHLLMYKKDIYNYANHEVYAALEESNWENTVFKR